MRSVEHESSQLLECETSNSIVVPHGRIAKTKGVLVGCMVPIILYQDAAIFGHFGPLRTAEASTQITLKSRQGQIPIKIIMYSINPTSSFWLSKKDEYDVWRKNMGESVAEATHGTLDKIEQRYYAMVSEVVIDWTEVVPNIFSQPAPVIS